MGKWAGGSVLLLRGEGSLVPSVWHAGYSSSFCAIGQHADPRLSRNAKRSE